MDQKRKITIITIIAVSVLVVLVVLTMVFRNRIGGQTNNQTAVTPTIPAQTITPFRSVTIDAQPETLNAIPTFTPEEGAGLNINSPVAQQSEAEIAKLYPFLPHEQNIVLPDGSQASFLIPQEDYQDNTWSILVNVYGIDFHVPIDSPFYAQQKSAFKIVVNEVLTWIKNRGADPNKVIIIWGDRAFIQDRAEEWLQN